MSFLYHIPPSNRATNNTSRLVWGFTLIEALIVIMITMIMTSVLIGHSRTSNKQIILFKEQAVLINALSRAKSLSLSTFQPILTTGGAPEPICGWGLHFPGGTSNSYILFKDLGDPISSKPCEGKGTYDSGEEFETFIVDPAVVLGPLTLDTNTTLTDIVFVPPQPKVIFNGGAIAYTEASLELSISGSPVSSVIQVTQGGQVNTQ